jgi:Leucine-rich repeat (LRR) protein
MRHFFYFFILCILATACQKSADNQSKELNLSCQKLSQLPDLSHYKVVERLYADSNQLKELPASLSQLQTLLELDISYNQFSDLPAHLAGLTQLKYIDLSHNQFKTLPAVVLSLPNLERLDLRYNQITDLPDEIQQLKKLDVVYLFGNNFSESNRQKFRRLLPQTKFVWLDNKVSE